MWEEGLQESKKIIDVNQYLRETLRGNISDEEARVSLAKFMRNNIGLTVRMMTGTDLFPFQEVALRGMLTHDNSLLICSRGLGKSFLGGHIAWLSALFEPGSKIGIIAQNFRMARQMFQTMENFANSKGGKLLNGCIKNFSHRTDEFSCEIGSSVVRAIPLGGGGKIRGFRFTHLIVDEMLLLPEQIINEVLLPFLSTNKDPKKREEIEKMEDKLVAEGFIKESDRTKFENNKFIGFTSASYKFEFLYSFYKQYTDAIMGIKSDGSDNKQALKSSHFVFQMSYMAAPQALYDQKLIEQAKNQLSEAQFAREFGAQFTDDSSGFFSMAKMNLCTIPEGQAPHVEIKGDKEAQYILAIDPNYSDESNSDHFAIAVLKIGLEGKKYLVHNYAMPRSDLKNNILYFHYLLKNFNIVYIIVDSAGGPGFIKSANESEIFKNDNLEIGFFEQEFENESEYQRVVKEARVNYNFSEKKIVHSQVFNRGHWIRRSNEVLQADIDHKRIWFASRIDDLESFKNVNIGIDKFYFDTFSEKEDLKSFDNRESFIGAKIIDFIEHQTDLIKLVKDECALIQLSTSANGTYTFDIPRNLKQTSGTNRPRRDSYTALLLANWGAKCYNDMMTMPEENIVSTFVPFVV